MFGFISFWLLEKNVLSVLSAIKVCWLGVKRNKLNYIWKQVMPYQLTNLRKLSSEEEMNWSEIKREVNLNVHPFGLFKTVLNRKNKRST
jgi:hypothetical protein